MTDLALWAFTHLLGAVSAVLTLPTWVAMAIILCGAGTMGAITSHRAPQHRSHR